MLRQGVVHSHDISNIGFRWPGYRHYWITQVLEHNVHPQNPLSFAIIGKRVLLGLQRDDVPVNPVMPGRIH